MTGNAYVVASPAVVVAIVVAMMSWGAPGEAHPNYSSNKTLLCSTMEPGHGVSAQPDSEFPKYFKLTGKEGTHKDFIVGIEALQENFGIKGYLITARNACTDEILIGQWTTAEADQILKCNGATGLNAVHHRPRKSAAVMSVSHSWSPIDKVNEISSLKFLITVVHKKSQYWVKQSVDVIPCAKSSTRR